MPGPALAIDYAALDETALVALARRGQHDAFRQIMQRSNQRLFRVARGVVGDDAEAEDVVQEAYVDAFEKLDSFRGDAALLTWLTRIVLNEAHGRLRKRRPVVDIEQIQTPHADARVVSFPAKFGNEDPAATAARAQIRGLLEHAIDALPEPFRVVFMMREIEECTVLETADSLGIRPETVKTRLHRARRLLRAALHDSVAATLTEAFPFLGARCQRMTETVLQRLAATSTTTGDPPATRRLHTPPPPSEDSTC